METVNKKYPLFCRLSCVQRFLFLFLPFLVATGIPCFGSMLCFLYIGMCDKCSLSYLSTKCTAK